VREACGTALTIACVLLPAAALNPTAGILMSMLSRCKPCRQTTMAWQVFMRFRQSPQARWQLSQFPSKDDLRYTTLETRKHTEKDDLANHCDASKAVGVYGRALGRAILGIAIARTPTRARDGPARTSCPAAAGGPVYGNSAVRVAGVIKRVQTSCRPSGARRRVSPVPTMGGANQPR
jgi:hypothetical protein